MITRRQQLESEISRHRELYYNEQPDISDAEFDALEDELRQIKKEATEAQSALIDGVIANDGPAGGI